jgi:hypothetical protein
MTETKDQLVERISQEVIDDLMSTDIDDIFAVQCRETFGTTNVYFGEPSDVLSEQVVDTDTVIVTEDDERYDRFYGDATALCREILQAAIRKLSVPTTSSGCVCDAPLGRQDHKDGKRGS